MKLLYFLALIALQTSFLRPMVAVAQSYDEIEGQVRQQIEADRARAIGDCSEVMISWLALRFTDVQQKQGKAHESCAAAQLFALRNGVPFLEALPRVAVAMGGIRSQICPPHATDSADYMLYSGCHLPPQPYVRPPPNAWDLARQKEVQELGPETLRQIQRCIPHASVPFAFDVQMDGRITNFNDAGEYGRIGPPPEDVRELRRIEQSLRSDARCNRFPANLRNRYASVKSENGRMQIAQVRDETAPNLAEMLRASPRQGR